jgi:hypothetical protein
MIGCPWFRGKLVFLRVRLGKLYSTLKDKDRRFIYAYNKCFKEIIFQQMGSWCAEQKEKLLLPSRIFAPINIGIVRLQSCAAQFNDAINVKAIH